MFAFKKYHGLGNDYIVLDPNNFTLPLTKARIKLICDRHFGVGADGILFGPIINDSGVNLRIFNPDGSEAEKSGNGIRIFAKYLCDTGHVTDKTFHLNTLGGRVFVEILDNNAGLIRIDMDKPDFLSQNIPVKGLPREVINEGMSINGKQYNVTCLTIGNPHCVLFFETVSKELAQNLGPLIENNDIFPNRTNVQFVKVIDKNNIRIEIWERGAGYTMASGSSSCAAVCAAFKLGLVSNNVNVHMPGGNLEINITEDGCVLMTGPVCKIMDGQFSSDFVSLLNSKD